MRWILAVLVCTLATGGASAATPPQGGDRSGKPAVRDRRPAGTDPKTTGPARRARRDRPHAGPRATSAAPVHESIPLGLFDGTGGFPELTEGAPQTLLKHTLAGPSADK